MLDFTMITASKRKVTEVAPVWEASVNNEVSTSQDISTTEIIRSVSSPTSEDQMSTTDVSSVLTGSTPKEVALSVPISTELSATTKMVDSEIPKQIHETS
jgi:hypothetical protein